MIPRLIRARITVIEATVKNVVRNEATRQVLGVQYVRKGDEHREYVLHKISISADLPVFCTAHFHCRWLLLKL